MPVMLADAIGNVSLDGISGYVAFDGYEGSPVTGRDLGERSVRVGFEANGEGCAAYWWERSRCLP